MVATFDAVKEVTHEATLPTRRETLQSIVDTFYRKPFTANEIKGLGYESAQAEIRMRSIAIMVVFDDYGKARTEAVRVPENSTNTGILKPDTIQVPEIIDGDDMDAKLYAYLTARKIFLDIKAAEVRASGHMSNTEEFESLKVDNAIKALVGEGTAERSIESLLDEIDKLKELIIQVNTSSDLPAEQNAQIAYSDKIKAYIQNKF